jgi:hypothetical protein
LGGTVVPVPQPIKGDEGERGLSPQGKGGKGTEPARRHERGGNERNRRLRDLFDDEAETKEGKITFDQRVSRHLPPVQ